MPVEYPGRESRFFVSFQSVDSFPHFPIYKTKRIVYKTTMKKTTTRGRPRDTRLDDAIARTTRRLLRERGYETLTMEAAAKAAGISKATLYRRWPNKAALVFETVFTGPVEAIFPPAKELESNVKALVRLFAREFDTPEARAAIPGLLAAYVADAALAEHVRTKLLGPAYAAIQSQLTESPSRLRHDFDPLLFIDALFSTTLTRAAILGRPLKEDDADRLVDMLLRGILKEEP